MASTPYGITSDIEDEARRNRFGGRGAPIQPKLGSTYTGGTPVEKPTGPVAAGRGVYRTPTIDVNTRGRGAPLAAAPAATVSAPGPISALAAKTSPGTTQPTLGNSLDQLPQANTGIIRKLSNNLLGAQNSAAENVDMSAPAPSVRKITGKDGSTTYTNDPAQPGGAQLGAGRGTLSIIGDPRTEGMSPAQAAEYWNSISAGIDAKNLARDQQAIISNSAASPTDSIATMLAKRANRNTAGRMLGLGVQQQQDAGQARQGVISSLASGKRTGLENEALGLGIQGKISELAAQKKITDLQTQYMNEQDPEKKIAIAAQINVLTGKDAADKYTPLMGKDDMGNPVYLGAFSSKTGEMMSSNQAGGVQTIPKAGEVKNGYRFKGGNPNDQNNWDKV